MQKLRIGIIDLVSRSPRPGLWGRTMNANFASIMPQAIGCWCEERGHEVHLICYTGYEDLIKELPTALDVVFIGAFTQAAQLSYSLSQFFRSRGAITVLGGPHARCYPQDARLYFDYVLGFTTKDIIDDLLSERSQHRPIGVHLQSKTQPAVLPGVRERWRFIESTLRKAPMVKIVPMISSLGCPYTCSFCIDAAIPYQQMGFESMKDDLRFLLTKFKKPRVGWHDPNFGVRFNECLDAIEEAVPPGRIDFIAESSLSLLAEDRILRLKRNGFKALLPGIESWFELGAKSKTNRETGLEKVRKVSDHVNMILRHIPYVQANFVLGLDSDVGAEPFELTKLFLKKTPGAFPGFSLLTAFGRAAPLNLEFQRAGRVLPFPFHFLNNNHAMNVRVKNYGWSEFYNCVIELTRYATSRSMMSRRLAANGASIPGVLNVIRAVSTEGSGRVRNFSRIRENIDRNAQFRAYFEQESTILPDYYLQQIKRDLGAFWHWLPDGAIHHDAYAYLKTEENGGNGSKTVKQAQA